MNLQGFYISATKRNSGKTTLCIAITSLLRDKGFNIQTFKKGPDFIDPMWLSLASGRNCYNLDFYFMSKNKLIKHFLEHSVNSDISIIEGNHGLHDSFDLQGNTSNASMAKLLNLPVILVVDVSELNRGVVPLLLGFKSFDENVNLSGVLLNKVHSRRHEKNLIKAIKYYTDIKIVGAVPNDHELSIKQRHLGLLSTLNKEELTELINKISAKISNYIDISEIIKIAKTLKKVDYPDFLPGRQVNFKKTVRIGLAYDNAFNFYYNENIEQLKEFGAELILFSPLADPFLPDVDAIYIGGGFPEIFSKELEANISLREDIKEKIEQGLPVYAECGGLIYLCKNIIYEGIKRELVGVIDSDVKLTKKPQGHGYTMLKPLYSYKDDNLYNNNKQWFQKIKRLKGHEFHHSFLENTSDISFAFSAQRGFGVNGLNDGILYKNVIASFTHLYAPAALSWFKNWLSFIKYTSKLKTFENK
jgi:cobyrinic acid a,c-diamide synthase